MKEIKFLSGVSISMGSLWAGSWLLLDNHLSKWKFFPVFITMGIVMVAGMIIATKTDK